MVQNLHTAEPRNVGRLDTLRHIPEYWLFIVPTVRSWNLKQLSSMLHPQARNASWQESEATLFPLLTLWPEDGGNTFLRYVDKPLPAYMVSHPRGWRSSLSPLWEPEISHSWYIFVKYNKRIEYD
jgi:hypothetical protein